MSGERRQDHEADVDLAPARAVRTRTPGELARELAGRARSLRRLALVQLADEREDGPLRRLHAAHARAHVDDRSEDEFADAFAQTITYGLLAARWIGAEELVTAGERFTRQTALRWLPATSRFLAELFGSTLSTPLAERPGDLSRAIDDLVDVLDRIDVAAVLGADDPVIHFYEPFLAAYDRRLKHRRGVYFTPRPVVSYIVRSTHALLQREFGLADGLGSTDTWGDVVARVDGLELPRGVRAGEPFVSILDPATGTATFLLECIEVIEHTLKARWCTELGAPGWNSPAVATRWREYVSAHLLPRLFGFELMLAPYAIAHLKLALKLSQTGFDLAAGERLQVYLTNSLEPAADPDDGASSPLSGESEAVSRIKRDRRFTVLVGNPPYAKRSANRSPHAENLVAAFKALVAGEINVQPLSDDYVKFIAHAMNFSHEAAVVCMITNRSFLEGLVHRGMRALLVSRCRAIRVVDLHGDTNVGEACPAGEANENVFDITQGVAVWSLVRGKPGPAAVEHADVWGTRAEKYAWLQEHAGDPRGLEPLEPAGPYYFLARKDLSGRAEQAEWVPLTALFDVHGMGVKTRRDRFLVGRTRAELEARFQRLADATDLEQLRGQSAEFTVSDSDQWTLADMRALVERVGAREGVAAILYRPFDTRFIWYHREAIERGDARWPVMRHVVGGELSLLSSRQSTDAGFTAAFVARGLVEMKAAERSRGSYVFPLRLAPGAAPAGRSPNIRTELVLPGDGASDADAAFAYVYAILHSPTYRAKYAAVLRIEPPRIPPIRNARLLGRLVALGRELVGLHLMESVPSPRNAAKYEGARDPQVERVIFSDCAIWIDKARTSGFRGVPEEVWTFQVGGYPVCEKWLKDRRGRPLTRDDIEHYQKILVALSETIRVMREIDGAIEQHGGWPAAFAAGTPPSPG